MNRRCLLLLAVVVAAGLLAPGTATAQEPAAQSPAAEWEPPRLPDGRPDLQGVWDFRTATPLERPEALAGRATLTDEEAAAVEFGATAFQRAADEQPPEGSVGAYNAFWLDFGTTVTDDRRSSLIVDPPDGRLPDVVEGALRHDGSLDVDLPGERPVRLRSAGIGADGPEDRGIAERCILGFNSGPPMMPSAYNNNMQLFQNEDHVVILNEMVHDARIVPLDGRLHMPDAIRHWTGDSRGRWDGDTLVVESRNFSDRTASFDPSALTALGTGSTLRLTERFTRVAEDTLLYEYTVDDPATFTRPFTVALPMRASAMPVFEYACHEGNYGMINALSGARAADAEQ